MGLSVHVFFLKRKEIFHFVKSLFYGREAEEEVVMFLSSDASSSSVSVVDVTEAHLHRKDSTEKHHMKNNTEQNGNLNKNK